MAACIGFPGMGSADCVFGIVDETVREAPAVLGRGGVLVIEVLALASCRADPTTDTMKINQIICLTK